MINLNGNIFCLAWPFAFLCGLCLPRRQSRVLFKNLDSGLIEKFALQNLKPAKSFANCNSNRTHGNKWELELLCNRQIGAFNQSKADKSKSFAKGPTLFCFVGAEKVFQHSGLPKSSDIPPTANTQPNGQINSRVFHQLFE